MKINEKLQTAVKTILILWFFVAMCFQQNIGIADNGDYTRSMLWITTGPIGIEPNWPPAGTEDWSRRFNNYWIPFWKLEWNISRSTVLNTSAILLWFPGALLNYLLYSSKILYLPTLSLFPKLLLFVMILLLFAWVKIQVKYRLFFLFGLAVPITFIFTSPDYISYFNSFYQETASFVFIFLFLASIIILKHHPNFANLLSAIAFLAFLTTSKASNIYWPLISIPLVIYLWSVNKKIKMRIKIFITFALIVILSFISYLITGRASVRNYPYHSLFYGVLTFSTNPLEHLRILGLNDDALRCINYSSFTAIGTDCFNEYQEEMKYTNTLKVICREPAVMFRFIKFSLDNMQILHPEYLGRYSFDDPRNIENSSSTSLLNLMGVIKLRFFPKGYLLAFILIVYIGWFLFNLKKSGFYRDLAIVGLLSTIACMVDMIVAILGDGKQELIKHLFLSNVLFDVAAIMFLNGLLLICFDLVERKLNFNNEKLSQKHLANRAQHRLHLDAGRASPPRRGFCPE